jgi:uncharacterized protein
MYRVLLTKSVCLLLSTMVFFLSACKDPQTNTSTSSFDRRTLLRNTAENIIIPAFRSHLTDVQALEGAVNQLILSPTEQTLRQARTAWITATTSWQDCAMYNFGPAETSLGTLTENIATFPASATKIDSYISKGDTTFRNFDRDSRGYYAVEYLLFAETPLDITNRIATNSNYKAYLRSLLRDIRTQVSSVLTAWETTYKEQFSTDNSTATGSAISELFNAMSMNFEGLKNFKVALPLGLRAGQTKAEPTKVEAYYSGESIRMIAQHFHQLQGVWYGKTLGSESPSQVGFDSYLTTLSGGTILVESTKQQFNVVQSLLREFQETERLSVLIENNDPRLPRLNTELQKLTRFLKSEMSSVLGIAITYSSSDGD